VHKFATQYFNLPPNHISVIEDAVKFVKKAQSSSKPSQYDYIVHDVFTGGAEPAELFTYEFLSGLHSLLKEDGVIAIVSSVHTHNFRRNHTNQPIPELRG
jgi:spermidine synthase